jgi:hypothetical protein
VGGQRGNEVAAALGGGGGGGVGGSSSKKKSRRIRKGGGAGGGGSWMTTRWRGRHWPWAVVEVAVVAGTIRRRRVGVRRGGEDDASFFPIPVRCTWG